MPRTSNSCCSVPQCRNFRSKTVTLHLFPRKDIILCRKWATALRIEKAITKGMMVCSEHFNENDFHIRTEYTKKRFLKRDVIPSRKIPNRVYQKDVATSSRNKRLLLKNEASSRSKKYCIEMEETNKIKMGSIANESVRKNDVETIYIKEEPIEFDEDVINIIQEVKNEIVHDDIQEDYDSSNNLINIKQEATEYSNEEIELEQGFSKEDIYNSKMKLKSYFDTFKDKYIKQYFCKFYSGNFLKSSPLMKHLRTHSTNKPYSCNICKKSFSQTSHLNEHLRTHSENKPYHCNICQKSFTLPSYLSTHLRIHSGDKPYHCNICKKSFKRSSHLIIHLQTHSGDKPYHCNICKNSFSRRSSLTRHLRIHSGDKPYHCDTCKKTFSQNSHLTEHLRIHSGDKPYHCNICKKSFAQSSNLTIHLQTHSGSKL